MDELFPWSAFGTNKYRLTGIYSIMPASCLNLSRSRKECYQVLLVDDHPLIRNHIKTLLERVEGMEFIGEAGDGREAYQLCQIYRPDLVLMDVEMPHVNGLQATSQILGEFPGIKILLFSLYSSSEYIQEAFNRGAHAYLLKDCLAEDITAAVAAVLNGGTFISPGLMQSDLPNLFNK
ncbi:MAG TPA: response regulator transcription factor [Syntrophomonadaceae bacterium]|nr:response regulator transcription factor [Syntrophomonadaceae bacterium]